MTRTQRILIGVVGLVASLLAGPARAENLFEGTAEVRLTGDRVRVRERALDDALRLAVTTAATSVFGEEGMKQKASELRLRVLPKVRSYVISYRIMTEEEEGPNLTLRLAADVNLELLSRDLATAVAAPVTTPSGPLAVCLTAGTKDHAERALARWKILRVAAKLATPDGSCPATFPADQPLLMIELAARPEGAVRGTTLIAAAAELRARLAKNGAIEASPQTTQYGWGADATVAELAAIDRAADKLGLQLVPLVGARVGANLPLVEVHLSWKRSWPDVSLLLKTLQQTAGVDRAAVQRVDAAKLVIEVEGTLSAAALLAGLERSPALEVRGRVEAGNRLELEVTRRPPPVPGSGT